MKDLMMTLAETGTGGDLGGISALVTAVIGAVFAGVAGLLGYQKGRKVKTEVEPNPLSVEIVESLATKEELRDLEGRLVGELKKLETALTKERDVARTANGNIHARIDKSSEALAEVKGELKQINDNLSRLLNIAITKGGRGA